VSLLLEWQCHQEGFESPGCCLLKQKKEIGMKSTIEILMKVVEGKLAIPAHASIDLIARQRTY
jgi:hypothetical protein